MTRSQKPLRIAMVSDSIYPYQKGGKELRLHELSERLAHKGHDVHIYTMKWWDGPNVMRSGDIWLHAICRLHPLYQGERRSMAEALWFGLATFKLMGARFDIIDVDHMPFFPLFSARIVCWLRGKKLHGTWHEVTELATWQTYIGRIPGFIGWAVEQISMRLPDAIVSNSDHTTRRLHQAGLRQPIETIPLGVNLSAIEHAAPSDRRSDLIFMGRLLAHKNVDLFIRALAILRSTRPHISGIIVGSGPEQQRLESLIREYDLQDNIEIIGFVPQHRDVYALMKASKVFVLPSVREGFSLVTIEANAAGLPVVTTNHPDNAANELITEGVNGYLADATPEAFAAQIERALQPSAKLQPSENAARYDWSVAANNLEKALVG